MARENFNELLAFVTIARELSFTKAAAQLGITQPALSHSMNSLEARLGIRLLTRTTRSVTLTDVGETLLNDLIPYFEGIQEKLTSLRNLSETPSGTIRISTTDYAIQSLIWPKIKKFLDDYPEITLELIDDYALTDIVSQRFDAGTRLGEQLTNGMISTKIGPPVRFLVVGAPEYFSKNSIPQHPNDLVNHNCINLRFPTHGNLYVWEFEKGGHSLKVKVNGQLVFSRIYQIVTATIDGYGLAFVPADIVDPYLKEGSLISVLEDWCPAWDGYFLYYPSRKQPSKAFTLFVDALRYHQE